MYSSRVKPLELYGVNSKKREKILEIRLKKEVKPLFIGIFLILSLIFGACGEASSTSGGANPSTQLAPAGTAAPSFSPGSPFAAGGVGTASASTSGSASTALAKLKVVATTTQIGDFLKNVGGNRLELATILKPNIDPHDYEPTAEDSKNLAAAQVVFSNGIGLDQWLDKVIKNSGTKARQFTASEGIKPRPGTGEKNAGADPHIWFDIENARKMIDNITSRLAEVDPAGASIYQANAGTYKEQLDQPSSNLNH